MSESPADYSAYIWAAYGLALFVYGGATLAWQQQLRRWERTLRELGGHRDEP